MAGSMKLVFAMLIATAVVAAFAPPCEAAISCSTVVSYLDSCVPYVIGNGPLGDCCVGIKDLYGAAKTTVDRQAVCSCLKSLAGSNSGVDPTKAVGLPDTCGVSVPYKISASADCSKVT